MNYESTKNEIIKLKKEELNYIDAIAKISSNKTLSEYEKLEIYRNLNGYEKKLTEILKKLFEEIVESKEFTGENLKDAIIEFDLGENYLSNIKFHNEYYKQELFEDLGIDIKTFKFRLTLRDLAYIYNRESYKEIDFDTIQNNQRLIENPIYIFSGYYDATEDWYGPFFGDYENYLYGRYENINSKSSETKEIPKKNMIEFEKDNIIIYQKKYVTSFEIRQIFEEELLNIENKTLNDCVKQTRNKVEELNYIRSPEYKEKMLLDKTNELYKTIKKEFTKPEKTKKNSVLIIPITQDKEYIITFKDRIKNKITAEFPSGDIEHDENPLAVAIRELKEKTGYITDDLFIVDEAYTSLETDNSITYIVIANNCLKADGKNITEYNFINYGLFSEIELEYLINENIINDAANKLAYYNLVNNVEDCNVFYTQSNKKIYKKERKKTNPFLD